MKETWRWYGHNDPISLNAIREAGATGIVTSLYHIEPDQVWNAQEVKAIKAEIERAGLTWEVVESIPVPNSVKLNNDDWRSGLDTFIGSMEAVAEADIGCVCYNFMPTFDWTRTSIDWETPTGLATRFDFIEFAIYDLFILQRPNAEKSYDAQTLALAEERFQTASEEQRAQLEQVITLGLPDNLNVNSSQDVVAQISLFDGMHREDIANNLDIFIKQIGPVADRLGVNLGIHPDDPPFPVFGLPRVVSNEADLTRILSAHDSPRNGLTFCTGSLGASADNNTVELFRKFSHRVNFMHLRNVTLDGDRTFFEDEHLRGQTDMVELIKLIRAEEKRRLASGRADATIPMRPDHGQLNSLDADLGASHGYSYIGRLKGLAELRGVSTAVDAICA